LRSPGLESEMGMHSNNFKRQSQFVAG